MYIGVDRRKSARINMRKLDVYEFTYDPNEEPPPPKKKKPVKKKPCKPKTVTYKGNYDKNLAKALVALKKTVAAKSLQKQSEKPNKNLRSQKKCIIDNASPVKESQGQSDGNYGKGYNSVRVEDIALQFQEDDNDINYSPINSPNTRESPLRQIASSETSRPKDNDPLNLKDDFSFFDEVPAASSSMNTSAKHPLASPWRVEFGSLPIKWNVNTYVKPNMTPSVETSFIHFNDNKKKHVYTNMLPEENIQHVVQSTPKLHQTSIVSFIQEVMEKSLNKKKNRLESTPLVNKIAMDVINHVTPVKNNSLNSSSSPFLEVSPESSPVLRESQNVEKVSKSVNKNSAKKKNKDVTYFGFDDTENQENITPMKKNKTKNVRLRSHAILKEINGVMNPGKVAIPLGAKRNALNNVNKVFDEVKSAMEPPVFPDTIVDTNTNICNLNKSSSQNEIENEDSQSIHLFEDIEVVHHLKPSRNSYGKTKKVTFRKNLDADISSDAEDDVQCNISDNLDDESFRLPCMKQKKIIKKNKTKKPKLSKKEEQELEAWAAGFNSMCDDIEEYDLVVE